jgi:hypothetical protein
MAAMPAFAQAAVTADAMRSFLINQRVQMALIGKLS